jgi:hypothetical protein
VRVDHEHVSLGAAHDGLVFKKQEIVGLFLEVIKISLVFSRVVEHLVDYSIVVAVDGN